MEENRNNQKQDQKPWVSNANRVLSAGGDYSERVLNESDPILREIWAEGYTHVQEDVVHWNLKLIDAPNEYMKEINLYDFRQLVSTLTFKRGLMSDGSIHTWVADADGSVDRLRELIRACR